MYKRQVEFSPLEDEENTVHEYNDIVRLEDRAEISLSLIHISRANRANLKQRSQIVAKAKEVWRKHYL